MVEITRNKWCEDLEEILQCPICMMIPIADIHQCTEGHIICINCKNQLTVCGFCNQDWSCRNRVAEDLCKLFGQIKSSLIDEDEEFKKLLIPDTVSAASQTDGMQNASKTAERVQKSPTGTFPCRIGTCNTHRFFDPLIKHLAIDHSNEFLQVSQSGSVFEYSWMIECTEELKFDRAIRITDVGTFFLKISTDVFGNFTGFVMMVQNVTISKQYRYQLEVNCCAEHNGSIYVGEVMTCRTFVTAIPEKCMQIKRSEMQRMLEHEKNLKCTLLLTMKPRKEDEKPPQQAAKAKHPKKCNNSAKPFRENDHNEPKSKPISPVTPGPSNSYDSGNDHPIAAYVARYCENSTSS